MMLKPVPNFSWLEAVSALRDQHDDEDAPGLVATLQSSGAGSAPMLCATDDGGRYWVKFPGNPQGTQTLVVEAIVAELGKLLGAPVLDAIRLKVPDAWVGTPYGPDGLHKIEAGLAHGSPLIETVSTRGDVLTFAGRDGNARRIPRLIVLWDWAMGEDEQWLYDDAANSSIWSFDHGWWLDAAHGPWTSEGLATVASQPWEIPGGVPRSIRPAEFYETADVIDGITEDQVALAVSRVPRSWEPDDALLGELAATINARRQGVAARARTRGTSTSKGARP